MLLWGTHKLAYLDPKFEVFLYEIDSTKAMAFRLSNHFWATTFLCTFVRYWSCLETPPIVAVTATLTPLVQQDLSNWQHDTVQQEPLPYRERSADCFSGWSAPWNTLQTPYTISIFWSQLTCHLWTILTIYIYIPTTSRVVHRLVQITSTNVSTTSSVDVPSCL